jgi:hypothetical protein
VKKGAVSHSFIHRNVTGEVLCDKGLRKFSQFSQGVLLLLGLNSHTCVGSFPGVVSE